jgi:cell wall-associated NlpC family hydrolase
MTISEDSPGIDWIDYDYDEGKHKAILTVTAHVSRWSCPPGSTVEITDMGIIDGKYLIQECSRSAYDTIATITCEKPLPILPEPPSLTGIPSTVAAGAGTPGGVKGGGASNPDSPASAATTSIQKHVVAYATKQLGVPYEFGGHSPATGFDCSGLAMCAYATVGIKLAHYTVDQWNFGRRLLKSDKLLPGDLVFFGAPGTRPGSGGEPSHVGIYVGGGRMIDAPHTGAEVRYDEHWQPNFGTDVYMGATRPWMAPSVQKQMHNHPPG